MESEFGVNILKWIDIISLLIEAVAVVIIVAPLVIGTIIFTYKILFSPSTIPESYTRYKLTLAKALLLGLEILVAADVVRTVTLEPSVNSLLALAILVFVRTFLSWALVVESEGRWPWQGEKVERIAS